MRRWSPAAPTRSCCWSTPPSTRPASAPNRTSGPTDGTPVIEVDRGGKITFHGPGQLVGYPIVRLPDHVLVVDYVRRLEEALIAVCADLGVTTARVPGRSGVWLQAGDGRPERKIAAIGIRVSRGVTMHGFALNCDVDLSWYERFVPCGIADAGVTTLSEELGRDVTVAEVLPLVEKHLAELLAWAPYDPTPDYEPRPEPGRRTPLRALREQSPSDSNPGTCVSPCSIPSPDPALRHAGGRMAEGCVDDR